MNNTAGTAARRLRRARMFLLVAGVLAWAVFWLAVASVRIDPSRLSGGDTGVVTDCNGRVLRVLSDNAGERCRWTPLADIPPLLREAFIVAEDRRFYWHPGIDLPAMVRALATNLWQGRIVSGASTLTQQLVRSVCPRQRTCAAKAVECLRALALERTLSKEAILEQYLNRVPMGSNLRGVGSAAEVYFRKAPRDLSPAECALLAALPKAPSRYSPYRGDRQRLRARRNWILQALHDRGSLDAVALARALDTPIAVAPRAFPFHAPHFVEQVLSRYSHTTLHTTLDLRIQQWAERIVRSHSARLLEQGAGQAAAMIVDNRTLGVLALVGSFEYGPQNSGYNNGALALRSPGSLLKPFLYGLAFDTGYTPASLLDDTQQDFPSVRGNYQPRNYDRREYNRVTARTALASSLNLSTLHLLNALGWNPFYQMLQTLHLINNPARGPEHYGLGLAIGNPEVTLEQMVTAYAALANGGRFRPLRYLVTEPPGESRAILSPQAAFLVCDILSDPAARALTFADAHHLNFPYRIAWKTGTSTHYRDSWAIGVAPEYTVGVWTGNFSGEPTRNLSGAAGAGPILADLVRALYGGQAPATFPRPEGLVSAPVCTISGLRPVARCPHQHVEWFLAGTEPKALCAFHSPDNEHPHAGRPDSATQLPAMFALSRPTANTAAKVELTSQPGIVRITYPLDGDRFLRSAGPAESAILFCARVTGPVSEITWYLDGTELARTGPPFRYRWVLTRGQHRLAAVGPNRVGDEIQFTVE